VLVQRLGTQRHLVALEIERARARAHRIEALLGGVAVLAQLLETHPPGTDGVDLLLVVAAQGVEDPLQAGVLGLDHHLQPAQRGAFRLEPLAP